ncbi:MAG: c-type cytochrome domain-containing protein [Bacteroidota bacterium]
MTRFRIPSFLVFTMALVASEAHSQDKSLTYTKNVSPIIKKYCLPCHLEENENPSGLAMDNYELLMKGGNEGDTVIDGKPKSSNLYLKLLADPPFGKQMPRNRRKLTEDEARVIYDWIAQGAKKD